MNFGMLQHASTSGTGQVVIMSRARQRGPRQSLLASAAVPALGAVTVPIGSVTSPCDQQLSQRAACCCCCSGQGGPPWPGSWCRPPTAVLAKVRCPAGADERAAGLAGLGRTAATAAATAAAASPSRRALCLLHFLTNDRLPSQAELLDCGHAA